MNTPKEQRGATRLSGVCQLLPGLHPVPRKENQHFYWNEKHQEAIDSVEQALPDATASAAPNDEGGLVLDTDASSVAIAGILHKEQMFLAKLY